MRDRIITAFTDMAYTKGFYNATVDELARRAGLSKRTIYRYFHSKDEIIETVIDNFIIQFSGEMEKIMASRQAPDAILSEVVECFFRFGQLLLSPQVLQDLDRHYPHYWNKINEFRIGKVGSFVQAFLDNSEPELVRDMNPHIISAAVLASIQAVLNPGFLVSRGLTLHEASTQLLRFFMHGFLKERA